jgi:hypothetical protein
MPSYKRWGFEEMRQVTRLNPVTKRLERPWRTRQHNFVLTGKGSKREILVEDYEVALAMVMEGHSIRMSDGRSPPSVVTPASLTIADANGTAADNLWVYTMPKPVLSREQLEQDIRAALVVMATDIYWIAGQEAADQFLGVPLDIHNIKTAEKILDLSKSPFGRTVIAAYEGAFRIGDSDALPQSDHDKLAIFIGALTSGATRRHPNPADDEKSPLRRTMLTAYWRGLISRGQLFEDNLLNSPPVIRLAMLAAMTEQGVRNALAKQGLSLPLNQSDHVKAIRWLERARGFTPLREQERLRD